MERPRSRSSDPSYWPISQSRSRPCAHARITKLPKWAWRAFVALVLTYDVGFASLGASSVGASTRGARLAGVPAWLALAPGTFARVDMAPWLDADEPEAALTESATSLARDFTANAERPGDVVFAPIGVRVRIVAVVDGGRIARVRGRDARFAAYAPVARLVPDVPPGTILRAAGGFAGYADFFPTLASTRETARRLETGSSLEALGLGTAPYDSDTADFVRLRVRVRTGALRGRIGWIVVAYAGLPERFVAPTASVVEKACACRLLDFGS